MEEKDTLIVSWFGDDKSSKQALVRREEFFFTGFGVRPELNVIKEGVARNVAATFLTEEEIDAVYQIRVKNLFGETRVLKNSFYFYPPELGG